MNTLAFTPTATPAACAPASASPPSAPFRIAAGALLALTTGRGRTVEVMEGHLWVTAQGDLADHFVGPGDRLPLGTAQRVVMENLASAPALLRLAAAG